VSATIEVTRAGEGFDVRVREGASETRHRVTLAEEDRARLAPGATAEATITAAFRFLLDREPKESILGRFDLCLISRYFPEFEKTLPDYLR
jgi:hypothetical protein